MNKGLLLLSCCAPCSCAVIEKLASNFEITVLYYNPNIMPKLEYEKRKAEQVKFLNSLDIPCLEIDYNHSDFLNAIKGYENLEEKSFRCYLCYKLRIEKTAKLAKKNNFDYFCTTLSVSPHKIAKWINEIMQEMEKKYQIKHLPSDFKKENGYLRSLELSKQHNFYRQSYCGCTFNLKNI